jgi:hypothetical protein
MDSPPDSWAVGKALDFLVGIETGVLGGLVMLAWFAVLSTLLGQPWWTIFNLYASEAYSREAVRYGPGWVTITGMAVHLTMAGIVGGIAGFFTPGGRLFGLGIALVWYLICHLFLWQRIAPAVPVYTHYGVLMSAFFWYGSVLGLHAQLRKMVTRPISGEETTKKVATEL